MTGVPVANRPPLQLRAPPVRAPRTRFGAAQVAATLEANYPGLVGVLERRVGDAQLAHDLLHDAIVTTLDKLDAGASISPDVLAGYVFRTALNHQRNRRRRDRAQVDDCGAVESALADADCDPGAQSQAAGMRELVRRVLKDLSSSRDREILVRYYLDEEDKLQLCQSMALTGPQFDRVIFRARDRLRSLCERAGFSRWDLVGVAALLLKLVSEAA